MPPEQRQSGCGRSSQASPELMLRGTRLAGPDDSIDEPAAFHERHVILIQQCRWGRPDRPVEPVIPAVIHFTRVSAGAAAVGAIPEITPLAVAEVPGSYGANPGRVFSGLRK